MLKIIYLYNLVLRKKHKEFCSFRKNIKKARIIHGQARSRRPATHEHISESLFRTRFDSFGMKAVPASADVIDYYSSQARQRSRAGEGEKEGQSCFLLHSIRPFC
jgi:hypothetical protein